VRILSVPAPLDDNPYQRLLYDAAAGAGATLLPEGKLDGRALRAHEGPGRILHLHWLWLKGQRFRRFLRSRRLARLMDRAADLGWTRIWTAHNVLPHDDTDEDRWLAERVANAADGIIVHAPDGVAAIRNTYRVTCPIEVIAHGHYRDAYPKPPARDQARATLGFPSDRPLLLAFGQVRPYKGFTDLARRFRSCDIEATLVIAGRPVDASTVASLESAAADDPRIHTDLRFHTPEQSAMLFAAADRVVLPYRRVTTSGALVLALGFSRPVVIPNDASLIHHCVDDAAVVFDQPDDLIPAIERALAVDPGLAEAAADRAADALEWGPIGEATVDFMRSLS